MLFSLCFECLKFQRIDSMAICDVLIIGSGIAGLSLAIKLSNQFPDRKIYVVTKQDELESNTRYAQGGISVVCVQIMIHSKRTLKIP